ncbi:MAG: hypothetical protein QS721_09900 [Candidatus Endonucleobacter sp. (ex Gigantidas childressi)]|nr:hypothetical protein [Candidatus Endonucleobacter sp. (ex Gigantidas childressi)]
MNIKQHFRLTSIMLWSCIVVIFVGISAFISQPPCDKPTFCPWLPDPKMKKSVVKSKMPDVTLNWNTVEGASVSYLFQPSLSKILIQLLYESESFKGTTVKQSTAITISSEEDYLLDAQAIQQSIPLPMPKHTLAKVSITINGSMEEEQARKVTEVFSQIIYQLHKPSNNTSQDK